MTEYKCEHPAEQPEPNPDQKCDDPQYPDPPEYTPPERCKPDCKCPPGPTTGDRCLEELIDEQTSPITTGDKAKAFKAELEAFLTKARAARDEYTADKYQKLVKQWVEQDREITELIRKLVCAVPCWRCIIECHVCPLLYDMRDAELRLYDDGKWCCSKAHDVQDQLYWHTRNRAARQRTFDRIKGVLAAWEKPAQTIEKILADNAKLIVDIGKLLGAEATKAVFDLFLRLIPLHLAIAPPKSKHPTSIDVKFTKFCNCDVGKPRWCCGIDVGERSLRQRITGPLPSLIDPNDYFDLICCLVQNAYQPAQDSLGKAEAEVTKLENQIKRLKAVIDDGLKTFPARARAAVPASVNCDSDDYKPKDDSSYPKY